jgi:hypothetical protein
MEPRDEFLERIKNRAFDKPEAGCESYSSSCSAMVSSETAGGSRKAQPAASTCLLHRPNPFSIIRLDSPRRELLSMRQRRSYARCPDMEPVESKTDPEAEADGTA